MCWRSYKPEWQKPHIAEDDIRVFKVLTIQKIGNKIAFYSPSQWFRYKLNKTYIQRLRIVKTSIDGIMEITEGLHSLAIYTIAAQYAASIGPQSVVLIAEIPKGSLFYRNEEDEIVSEKLKVLSLNSI